MAWYSRIGVMGYRLGFLHVIGFWDRLLARPIGGDDNRQLWEVIGHGAVLLWRVL